MKPLARELRNRLENVIIAARKAAEKGAVAAVERLAVAHPEPFGHMTPAEKALRNRLRARALGALGDPLEGKRQGTNRLTREVAYEHWHRMLFARFLAENALLIHPDGVPVTLAECEELAREERAPNGWALAERYAARMLPQIFRPDDPVLQVPLAPEDQQALERLLDGLPPDVFAADDSLGWCYQFWQSEEKKRVNESGEKITGETLPAVTQLFTEHYMVQFLLDNTLGAWWAGKNLTAEDAENAETEDDLRRKLALPGVPWEYLRFIRDEAAPADPQSAAPTPGSVPRTPNTEHLTPISPWRPAAGTFPDWPKAAKEITVLDPCCGSGHFLVAALHILVPMRMREEGLSARDACDAVLRDNLFGLEIDPRCAQIAAFALAFAAWRYPGTGGYRPPHALNVACSGIAVSGRKEEWLDLANGDRQLADWLGLLHDLFALAPELGSLIDPRRAGGDLLADSFRERQSFLEKALAREGRDEQATELAVAARGLARATEALAGTFTLLLTNVPYLSRWKQGGALRDHCDREYGTGKADLATAFLLRCLRFAQRSGTIGLVTPQNWAFLLGYKKLRIELLKGYTLDCVAKLGPAAFHDMNWWASNTMLSIISKGSPKPRARFLGLDVSRTKDTDSKALLLQTDPVEMSDQSAQLRNPDARIAFGEAAAGRLLSEYADALQGVSPADYPHYARCFWEVAAGDPEWRFWQSTVEDTIDYGGRELVLWFGEDLKEAVDEGRAFIRGERAWGKWGVVVSAMRDLPCTLYTGEPSDTNVAILLPHNANHLTAIWAYCLSPEYQEEVRRIDQAVKVTNGSLSKVPFDLERWQEAAAQALPSGLPKPSSPSPTQWLYSGFPAASTEPLHVGAGRLLGYRWPRQNGTAFADCPSLGPDGLERFVDDDGVVCLPSVGGERPAADRLRELLAAAFGADWSPAKEAELLAGVGYEGQPLDDWLRDVFFDQHCKLFHQRPFIWHVWDGRKDGFAALVNYHRLDRRLLEKLAFAYLNDWIRRQEAEVRSEVGGAEARLGAAQELQRGLALILEGEPPHDIFVRWKPLVQQPIGWEPDLNDGVRINIRPFVAAGVLRKNPNINWRKDRGKEPERPKDQYPWFWGWDEKTRDFPGGPAFDGNRWNDCHYTSKAKHAARDAAKKGGSVMANIYEEKTEGLHELLDRARADDGATVLIPDLQRPYVWTPNQVSLLVDSLIRGWPFGTLLMWKVGQGELQGIPHRQFWRVVDRTGNGNGSAIARKDPPAAYHMVLDGQQRVQSLLLALGGDAWGFKLEDRDWAQELQDRRPRGRQGKYRHWSKASLCFDLDRFLAEYTTGGNLLAVDFRNVLQWAITDPTEGQSKWSKPSSYEEPLARSFAEQHKGRFIRLSRLWAAAAPNPNIKEAQFRVILKDLFGVEGVPADKADRLLVPMGELMTTLRDVKVSKVTYLELVPFDKNIWTEDSYNDAIVNIFTRLNTAGRTLTREEITLAWLKVGWDPAATGGKTAGECFQALLAEVADRGLNIEMDNLVNAVSFIWSVCCNQGQLLANRDLLRGGTIRPMASELAKRWSDIWRAVLAGLDAVSGRGLEYGPGGHYSSLNALAVVWTWLYLAFQWEAQHGLTVPQKDDLEKKLAATLSSVLDRWLICSQWAGRWAGSSASIIAGYAKGLHEEFLACARLDALEDVHKGLSDRFQAFVKELEIDATNFVGTLAASSRERVSVYRTALWMWHRLDAKRWEMSCIPLRVGKSKPSLDVDHAVAHALWKAKLAAEPLTEAEDGSDALPTGIEAPTDALPTGIMDRADALLLVNRLGNCSLEKTFNISKSDKTLRSFMEQVHEFKEGKVPLSSWAQALGLEDSMLDAEAATPDAIVEAISNRDFAIRAELFDWVKGTRTRADL